MNTEQLKELVLQSLEHEQGGVKVYATALESAQNSDLKAEWLRYFEQTQTHVTALEKVATALGIDPATEIPGRKIVRTVGAALVAAMKLAQSGGNPAAAQLVACECVVLAETKDHADWELLSKCAEHFEGPGQAELKEACEVVEDQEDEHLYHTKGWCRELWLESLGLSAILPPPEERRHVTTAIGAATAEQAAEKDR